MRFTINGWHPVASHLVCIIAGMAIVNLSTQPVSGIAAPPESLMFTVSQKAIADMPDLEAEQTDNNIKVDILSQRGHEECRMFRSPLAVRRSGDWLHFSTQLSDQFGLSHLTKDLRQKSKIKVNVAKRTNSRKIPLCKAKPRVTYAR